VTIETIIRQYDFNLEYAKALVQDLTDEHMTMVPALGHLISGSANLAIANACFNNLFV